MSQIEIVPSDRFGLGFVDPKFLKPGEDEYTLRNVQSDAARRQWRPLSVDEIALLEKNGNTCADWGTFLVEDPFNPALLKNSLFAGLVRVGALTAEYLRFHDFTVPAGITNSRVISCDIGADCAIHDCAYLSHYVIGNRVIMSRIDEMSCTDHAKFGEGVVKEGEDESVRIWLDPMNEAGGRSVLAFAGMTCADAWLWATYRDDAPLMARLKELTQNGVDLRRGWYGTVGDHSIIKSCQVIKDTKFGPSSYVKGANKLKNLTIHSADDEPTQIGEGVELVNGIIGYGCRVFYGVKAVRFVLGNNSSLKYGARLIHSILGDNSTVSCCEVLNNLVFPGHEQHHNNSFLIATLIMGQSNMAAGATVGSNHNSRGNDGEIVAGRGFWPGLSSTLKHNCRFASYTLLTKGSYPAELNIMFPFSMVYEDRKNDVLCVMPAYYWLYNMYALERNSWKYRTRDRRVRVTQRIETDHLAPDTAFEMIASLRLLERWTGKAWFAQQAGVGALASEGTIRDVSSLDEATLEAKGRELIVNNPDVVNGLSVRGEMMERFTREVRIMKVVKAWNAYRQMLLYYGVRTVAEYLVTYGIHYDYFSAQVPAQPSLAWVNMGGQLVSETRVDGLRAGIRSGLFGSWDDIHAQYEQWWASYPRDKAENAYECLKIVEDADRIPGERWNELLSRAVDIRDYIENQVYVTKKKDYSNAYRGITYRNSAERDAVLGTVEDNSFVKTARAETAKIRETFEKARA